MGLQTRFMGAGRGFYVGRNRMGLRAASIVRRRAARVIRVAAIPLGCYERKRGPRAGPKAPSSDLLRSTFPKLWL